MTQKTKENDICCPRFDPELWDEIITVWEGKKFIKAKVCTVFYMPLNFGSVMRKLDSQLRKAGKSLGDSICLSDHTSKWNMDIYLSVDEIIPGLETVDMSGTFLSKVYEGHFKETGAWRSDFETFSKGKGYKAIKSYMWYTTCPKCAKKYGKNYVVIIAKVEKA